MNKQQKDGTAARTNETSTFSLEERQYCKYTVVVDNDYDYDDNDNND